MSGIRVSHLKLQYSGIDSLVVSIGDRTVEPGEFMAIMGESGSGKTSLIRLIAGLESPDEGNIYIGGEWMNGTSVGRRPVQMISQSLALWPHLKVMDERGYSNLNSPLKIRRWTREQIVGRVRGVSDRVGLKEEFRGSQRNSRAASANESHSHGPW
jgi:iron(III) transport system ATP-binding protein